MSQSYNQYPFYGYQQAYTAAPRTQPPYGTQPGYPIMPSGGTIPGGGGGIAPSQGPQVAGMLPLEQSYVENILRLNKGKLATVYATFENNTQWNAKVFKGIIEAAGRDHLILSDPETGMRFLILMIYVDYVTFEEEIEYEYPFNASPGMVQYTPR